MDNTIFDSPLDTSSGLQQGDVVNRITGSSKKVFLQSNVPGYRNELSQIRHQIYFERTRDDHKDRTNNLEHLGLALFGPNPPDIVKKTLQAASLLYAPEPNEILELVRLSGGSEFLDRYLADALFMHPTLLRGLQDEIASGRIQGLSPNLIKLLERKQRILEPAQESQRIQHPVSLVQCMFYGDPSRSGRGASGGIATLLSELGSTLPQETGGVVTLVLYDVDRSVFPFVPVERVSENHSIVRVPMKLHEAAPKGFLLERERLMEGIEETIHRYKIHPKIIHVRFLDDASLAAAKVAKKLGVKLVATITPDPHRQLCDENGNLKDFSMEQGLDYLNKILIGDELVNLADGVLAIGKETIERELLPYYPQLEDTRNRQIRGIDEGVRSFIDSSPLDLFSLLQEDSLDFGLSQEFIQRPILLSIGRLALVKNQCALLRAWGKNLWREYNLVFIGGDHENPSREEAEILAEIKEILGSLPQLRGRFCHLPGRSNKEIRSIQKILATDAKDQPHLYVCPSLKEEFGLSILEAMSVGMVVCAPMKGGAPSYIRHGINGFLLDTSSSEAMELELESLIMEANLGMRRAHLIGDNASRTVQERYSMERISQEFSDFYRRLLNE